MAKRKPPSRRRLAAAPKRATGRKAAPRKTAARKATARKSTPKTAKVVRPVRRTAKKAAKKAVKRTASKATPKRIVRRLPKIVRRLPKAAASKTATPAKKLVKKAPLKAALGPKRVMATKAKAKATAATGKKKHALGLDRERRVVGADDDIVSPTPPSSLNLDRSASSARTGRQELKERYDNHTETSPALTGGDVDADWESAYSVGDEAPGGDNPTPDQNNVDDIGVALGVEYADNEELEGADKIEERDRHRWEDDPASSEDFDDR
jgi:hypothetical protein